MINSELVNVDFDQFSDKGDKFYAEDVSNDPDSFPDQLEAQTTGSVIHSSLVELSVSREVFEFHDNLSLNEVSIAKSFKR